MHGAERTFAGKLGDLGTRLHARATLWQREHGFSPRTRRALSLALLGAGSCWCVWLYGTIDWPLLRKALHQAGPSVALLFVAPLIGNAIHMLGWRTLLPPAVRPGLWRGFRIFVAAQAGNELGLGVLGESVKIAALPPRQLGVATSAVVLDNLTALVALGAVIGSVTAFLRWGEPLASARCLALGIILGGGTLVVASAVAWRRSDGRNAASLLAAFLAHYLGKLWIVAEFALALSLLAHATARSSALLGLTSTLASCVGALVPGQLGVLEAALVGSAAAAQLSVNTVLGVSLLRRIRGVMWIALGAWFFAGLCASSLKGDTDVPTAAGH